MNFEKTLAVIKRELREKMGTKAFIISTISIPLIFAIVIGIQTTVMTVSGDKNANIMIITNTEELRDDLRNEFVNEKSLIEKDGFVFSWKVVKSEEIVKCINELKTKVQNDKLNAILYISNSALKDKKIDFYSKNPNNLNMFQKLQSSINKVLLINYFKNKNISENDINYAKAKIDFTGYRVTLDNKIAKEGFGNQIAAFIFTFLLYMSLLMSGGYLLTSVVEEKNNRIVEIMLCSITPTELMIGKIIGSAITSLAQMAVWLSPVLVVSSNALIALPSDFILSISTFQLIYFFLNYFIGIVTFLGLYAMIGSMFDNPQDAQNGLWPVMMLIIIPFMIAISLASNPSSPLGLFGSMLPFASIIVMPARMAIVEIPSWHVVVALIVNILTLIAVFPLAGKIYKVGIMITGKKPSWKEVYGWLKM